MEITPSETIVISDFGIFVGKESGRLIIRKGDTLLDEIPLFRIRELIIAERGVTISSDLIQSLMENGIKLFFTDGNEEPYAVVSSPFCSATVITRREQFLAYNDSRGGKIAKIFALGKIRNMRSLLLYLTKNSPARKNIEPTISELEANEEKLLAIEDQKIDNIRGTILGIEGASSARYWNAICQLLAKPFFKGREGRGAFDQVNMALNYGYGILYGKVWSAIIYAGLDPYAGFLHVDRPGKPSLVLDLIEEFRQPIVDKAVFGIVNRGIEIKLEKGRLDKQTRRLIAEKVLNNLELSVRFEKKNHKLRSVIQIQARNLASFLRGEREYKPYRFKW